MAKAKKMRLPIGLIEMEDIDIENVYFTDGWPRD